MTLFHTLILLDGITKPQSNNAWKPLIILAKYSILDVRLGSKYASDIVYLSIQESFYIYSSEDLLDICRVT